MASATTMLTSRRGSGHGSEGVDGEHAGYEGIQSATILGLRGAEGCLRGNDDVVCAVDEGVESAPLPLCKRGRLAMSDCPTFSDFCGQVNDFGSGNKTTESFLPKARFNIGSGCLNISSRSRRSWYSSRFLSFVFGRFINNSPWERKCSITDSVGFLSIWIHKSNFLFNIENRFPVNKFTECGKSDTANRPHFDNWSYVFFTPRRPPKHPTYGLPGPPW